MGISEEKQKKLAYVARRYYLDDWKQSDIAKELGVSRPLISRMLTEAREHGVVEIRIHDPAARQGQLVEQLRHSTSIRDGVLVEDGRDDDATNQLLSQGAVQLLWQLRSRRLGIGWGHLIGQLVTWLEAHPQLGSTVTDRWAGFSRSTARSRAGMSAGTRPSPTVSAVTLQWAKSSSTSPLSPPPSVMHSSFKKAGVRVRPPAMAARTAARRSSTAAPSRTGRL